MLKPDWLALVAVHSDAWLMSVAFYYGAKLDANARQAYRLVSPISKYGTRQANGLNSMQAEAVSQHQHFANSV